MNAGTRNAHRDCMRVEHVIPACQMLAGDMLHRATAQGVSWTFAEYTDKHNACGLAYETQEQLDALLKGTVERATATLQM